MRAEVPLPRWAWAAISDGGDVPTLSAKPYWAWLVVGTGGFRFVGSNGNVWATLAAFGATSAASAPPVLNGPAKGAGIPPNASHGERLRSTASAASGPRPQPACPTAWRTARWRRESTERDGRYV